MMPTRETLRTTLLSLLEEEMGEPLSLPTDEQDLRESLGLDSVDIVGLVMRIERQFRIRLASEELAAVKSTGDLLDLMESKLAGRPDDADIACESDPVKKSNVDGQGGVP
jgi:acyl carrier protein